MTDHQFLEENLAAYLAGGLDTAEREKADKHLAECPECARRLEQAQRLDRAMTKLFSTEGADGNLESRAIRRLRNLPRPMPRWVRYVVSAAAVLLLGVVGLVLQAVASEGGFGYSEGKNEARLPSLATMSVKRWSFFGVTAEPGVVNADNAGKRKEKFTVKDVDESKQEFDTDIQYNVDRVKEISVPGALDPKDAVGIRDGQLKGEPSKIPAPGVVENGNVLYKRGMSMDGSYYGRSGSTTKGLQAGGGEDERTRTYSFGLSVGDSYYPTTKPHQTPPPVADLRLPIVPSTPPAEKSPPKKDDSRPEPKSEKSKDYPKELPPAKKDSPTSYQPDKTKPKADPNSKIIRTGEIEFEVESWDDAVKTISKVRKQHGGVEGTINNDKLPNGKMKGSVIVRMPPEQLDDFIDDLRRALGKTADLKYQRLSSQDVGKQYADTESELRAAVAMEERLLKIIKEGTGQVKDLLEVERELGVQRTKMEKMKGLIQYFKDQISMSTLTINLVEKEIQAAAALVVNAREQMRIEVEEVTKARKTVEKAAAEMKGRIVKSEEKQQPNGQVQAIVHAEIKPASREAFRDMLKKLGIVSAHEASQSQTTEGGSTLPLQAKARENDVVFELTLMNAVNVLPKNAVELRLVSTEVAAHFARLQEEVVKFKGQVHTAKKEEPDPHRVTAQLMFDIPKEHKAAIDKLIEGVGPVLTRDNQQAKPEVISTEQKIRYGMVILSIGAAPYREKVNLKVVDVKDVEKKANELAELAKAAKGQVSRPKIRFTPQGQKTAEVVIRVPLTASESLLRQFREAGKPVEGDNSWNAAAPDNELATAEIHLSLTGETGIVPEDQGLGVQIRLGLYRAFWIFSVILVWVITGLAGVLPVLLVIFGAYKVITWTMGGGRPMAGRASDGAKAFVPPSAPSSGSEGPAKT